MTQREFLILFRALQRRHGWPWAFANSRGAFRQCADPRYCPINAVAAARGITVGLDFNAVESGLALGLSLATTMDIMGATDGHSLLHRRKRIRQRLLRICNLQEVGA